MGYPTGLDEDGSDDECNSQPITDIQAEDKQYTGNGNETDKDFYPGDVFPVDEGVKQCGKETGRGDAGHADRYVGCLNAGIEGPILTEWARTAVQSGTARPK